VHTYLIETENKPICASLHYIWIHLWKSMECFPSSSTYKYE